MNRYKDYEFDIEGHTAHLQSTMIECPYCRRKSHHASDPEVFREHPYYRGLEKFGLKSFFTNKNGVALFGETVFFVVACKSCNAPFVVVVVMKITSSDAPLFRVAVLHSVGVGTETDYSSLPPKVQQAYEEAHRCINANSPTGTVACARACVEQTLIAEGCAEDKLDRMLKKAKEETEIVPLALDSLATLIKAYGDSHHSLFADVDDAITCMEALETFVFLVYGSRERSEKAKSRFSNRLRDSKRKPSKNDAHDRGREQ